MCIRDRSCGSSAGGGLVGAPPPGQGSVRVYVNSSMLPRILWRQCQEALRDEEGIGETSSDVQYSAAATHGTATLAESCDGFEAPAACRGTAFLRATCLLWAAEQLSHGQGWVGGIWLRAAVALMQQAPYDLKTIGARLTLLLLNKAAGRTCAGENPSLWAHCRAASRTRTFRFCALHCLLWSQQSL